MKMFILWAADKHAWVLFIFIMNWFLFFFSCKNKPSLISNLLGWK